MPFLAATALVLTKSPKYPRQPAKMVTEEWKTMDLIINAGITSNNIRLGFGPVFHFWQTTNLLYRNSYLCGKTGSYDLWILRAVGYDIGNLALDLRYENALTTIGDHVFFGAAKSKFRTGANQITFSVGYGFWLYDTTVELPFI